MANILAAVIPQVLAQGLVALRENAIMPRLVNRRYETEAVSRQGSSIEVPIPSAIVAKDVVPSNTPPQSADVAPSSVSITLDQWKDADFSLTDKEQHQVMNGYVPMQATEAVKSLCNAVDKHLLGLCTKFYGWHGTAGTTPFGTPGFADATQARKILQRQLAPNDPRYAVLGPDAEAALLTLREVSDASWSSQISAILDGNVNRRIGISWLTDQNVTTHIAGAASGYLVNGTPAVGDTAIPIDTGSGAFNVGDIVTFAGHDQTYVVTGSAGGATATEITVQPGLVAAPANNAAVTSKATHTLNPIFHRDAIALATRPLSSSASNPNVQSMADPVTGLVLRLEVTRQHKQDMWNFDIHWGAEVVRREYGMRLAG